MPGQISPELVAPNTPTTLRYTVEDFTHAGVNSFVTAPGQNPDTFEMLTNIMPVTNGSLVRRWGYNRLSNPALAARRFYEYQSDSAGTRRWVITSTTSVQSLDETGAQKNTGIFSPTSPTAAPRMVNSRDFAYFVDGVTADCKKWDGNDTAGNGTSKWGIVAPDVVYTTTTSTTSCGTGADSGSGAGAHPPAWVNPGNITANDGAFATATWGGLSTAQSHTILATNFGFAVPANAEIKGILFEANLKTTTAALQAGSTILKNGASVTPEVLTTIPTTLTYTTVVGSSSYLGGQSWSSADINSSSFGLSLYATGSFTDVASIDNVRCTVYYSIPITIGATGVGAITLTVGRKYYYVYRNSVTGQNSGLSVISASTGALTANNQALSDIVASADTQVDRKLVLATADGGDPTTLYLLADIPNATTTLTDNIPETTLLLQPIYQETDASGNDIGVADNDPPPNGTLPTKHLGRLYLVFGQYLYFSKNAAELTTSTGTLTGKYEECWPSDHFLDISEGAETIRGVLSDGQTLYLATDRHVRRLSGDGPASYNQPEILFNEGGILTQESWQICFVEDQPIGTFWLTPDFRVIGSDFNVYKDVGTPIQDTLNSINRAQTAKIHAAFVGIGSYDLYVLAIPTGSNTECDTLCVYDLRNKKWFIWTCADTPTTMHYNIDASGNPQWLMVAATGKLYQFGSSYTQDRTADTPVSITSTIRTPYLHFGEAQMRKVLNEIELMTGDSGLLVSVDGASTTAEFASPQAIKTSAAIVTSPLGTYKVYLADSTTKSRWYRFKFVSTATSSIVLDYHSTEFAPMSRI